MGGTSSGLAKGAREVVGIGETRITSDFLNLKIGFLKQPDGLTDTQIVEVTGGVDGEFATKSPVERAAMNAGFVGDAFDGEQRIRELIVHALFAARSEGGRGVMDGIPRDDGKKNGVGAMSCGPVSLGSA